MQQELLEINIWRSKAFLENICTAMFLESIPEDSAVVYGSVD
jgi:hypothetical protein